MKFKHSNFENFIELNCDKVNFLIIENKHKLWRYLSELNNAIDGEITDFILVDDKFNDQQISKNCVLETDLVKLTMNSKKITTSLFKKSSALMFDIENEFEFKSLMKKLYVFCHRIGVDVGYDVVLDEDYDPIKVLKLFAMQIKEKYDTILEKLIVYINLHIELLGIKIFIFSFLTKFLAKEEMIQLFKHCELCEVSMLIIEDKMLSDEYLKDFKSDVLVIDNDLCEILIKN